MVNQMRKLKVDGDYVRKPGETSQHASARLSIAGADRIMIYALFHNRLDSLKAGCHCELLRSLQPTSPTDNRPINSDLVKGRLYLFKSTSKVLRSKC